MMKRLPWVLTTALVFVLSACGRAADEELREWMAFQVSQAHSKVTPLAEPKQFKPETYSQVSELHPFSNQKLTVALKKDSPQASASGALLTPELARRREPLEEFPLDSMVMVGRMERLGKPVALITIGKLLYQVRLGDHLGLDYGLVTNISATEVSLREIVQDAAGEWIERTASLQLQERSK